MKRMWWLLIVIGLFVLIIVFWSWEFLRIVVFVVVVE